MGAATAERVRRCAGRTNVFSKRPPSLGRKQHRRKEQAGSEKTLAAAVHLPGLGLRDLFSWSKCPQIGLRKYFKKQSACNIKRQLRGINKRV